MIAVLFQRVEFLRKIHLFRGLPDEDLTAIAGKMEERAFASGKTIIQEGMEGDRFFLIFSGRVRVTRREGRGEALLAELVEGDYFGEESLLKRHRRNATVTADDETVLLTLSREAFQVLVKQVAGLRTRFEVTTASHRLARRKKFSWLEKGEVVYFVTRKHEIELWRMLTGPVLCLLLPLLFLIVYALTASTLLLYLAGLSFTAVLLWIVWRVLDWSNDYYVVTNRRVVWLEKIIGMYDSRQEAPLTTILSINSETDLAGRVLGYGDVVVRTFVGKIVFNTVGHPDEVVDLVREYWERTRDVARRANIDALKHAIREKLGLAEPQEPASILPPQPDVTPLYKPTLLQVLGVNLFKIRFEERGVITYRKHWFVLFKHTWLPGLLTILLLIWLFYNLAGTGFVFGTLPTVIFMTLIGTFLWWLYQVVDWSNDIFQVTSDQIMDIDKKPLGRLHKNVAPLENILNMEARREGLMQVLFNYGNVYIAVGGAQLVFENVVNPTLVQQDIDRRRVARRDKQDQERVTADRDRLAEFFAMYHNNADGLRHEQEIPDPDGASQEQSPENPI